MWVSVILFGALRNGPDKKEVGLRLVLLIVTALVWIPFAAAQECFVPADSAMRQRLR